MLKFHHFVEWFLQPPVNGGVLFCILLGILLICKTMKWLLVLLSLFFTLIIIYLQYTPLFAKVMTFAIYPRFESNCKIGNNDHLNIVVLGAGTALSVNMFGQQIVYPGGATFLSLDIAYHLSKELPLATLILSGGNTAGIGSEALAMANYLRDKYHVVNPFILEDSSLDTDENARYTAQILRKIGVRRAILVTQASHMWRSKALFSKYGITVTGCPAWDNYDVSSLAWYENFFPNVVAYNQSVKLIHEVIGYFVYVIF